MSGRLIMPASADREAWLAARMAGIGSSDIAAVVGLSSFSSPFDLYWSKVTGEDDWDEERLYWGRRLETAIADRFAEEHPEFAVRKTGLWGSKVRGWQLATPDRLLSEGRGRSPVAVLEVKTDGSFDGWGEPGSDDVPVAHRCQVLQQMDVVGVDVAYLAVLVAGRWYREYVVERDQADLDVLRKAGADFWERVEAGRTADSQTAAPSVRAADFAPNPDAHPATTDRLKKLHPDVEDRAVEIPRHLIGQRRSAKHWADTLQAQVEEYDNQIRELMGNARYATVDGDNVATRSVFERKGYTVAPGTVHKLTVSQPKPKKAIR